MIIPNFLLTRNGNLVVPITNPNGGEVVHCYATPEGEFLRECTYEEVLHLQSVCMWIRPANNHQLINWAKFPINGSMPQWHLLGSFRIEEDYTNFKPETGSNGGDYGYWKNCDVYGSSWLGYVQLRTVIRHGTTADFDYDVLTGQFQQCGEGTTILNAVQEYTIPGTCDKDIKDIWYPTQGESFVMLEQISELKTWLEISTLILVENGIPKSLAMNDNLFQEFKDKYMMLL